MVTHYAKPQMKIRIDPTGNDDKVQTVTSHLEVVKRLNAIDTASFIIGDADGVYFNNTIVYGDEVAIYLNYFDESGAITTTDLRFYGFVEDLTPQVTDNASTLKVDCRGYGRCMLDMTVNEEYGTESVNPTIDELHEILQDNTVGIIDNYVEEINNSGAVSGYTVSDTYIEPDTDVIKYIYFPFKPAKDAIHDLQLVFQALQTHSTAGWHWIFQTQESPADTFTHRFMLTQVANHSVAAPDINAKWPTWWNTDQAGSTLVERVDFISSAFKYQRPQGNYVIYAGELRKPGDGDRWTQTTAGWGDNSMVTFATTAVAGDFKVGTVGLNCDFGVDGGNFYYPSTEDAAWAIESWGGQYNLPSFNFWIKSNAIHIPNPGFYLDMYTDRAGNDLFRWTLSDINTTGTWAHFQIPLGPYARSVGNPFWGGGWSTVGAADWDDIDFFQFTVVGDNINNCTWKVDGIEFNGHIIRAAKKLQVGGAVEDYYKQVVITDNVAKDDSGTAADHDYIMGQMAYGELLRVARRPLTGTIQVPMLPTIQPGSLAHIHGSPYSGGYRINGDMRVLVHRISASADAGRSYLTLTDDLINGSPLPPPTLYNTVLQATNPEFQNRQISSIKTRGIDITQPILEKTYQFNDYY